MDNNQILIKTFSENLDVDESVVIDSLEYNSIKEWDSIAHMSLIAGLEEAFDIFLDTDDIIDMSSVKICKEILAKYDIRF